MADNVTITAGTGTTIAADDVGGVKYQVVKLDVGGDGAALPVSASNPVPVTAVITGAALTSLALIDDVVFAEDAAHVSGDKGVMALAVRKDTLATISGTDGDYAPLQLTASGSLRVAISEDAIGSTLDTEDGSVASGQSNVALVVGLPYTYSGAGWVRGGFTPYKLNSAATTNATSLKATPGIVGMIVVTNVNAAVRYLKFYNKATAPTVGTDTPLLVFAIPASTTGGGIAVPVPDKGIAFSTGIAFALTTGATDADTNAVGANDIIVNIAYL